MAVSNKTYNNVVNTLCRLGQYHDQISTVSVGDIYEINLEKMEKMPLLHINPTSVTTASLGMALIKVDEGFRICSSGKAI